MLIKLLIVIFGIVLIILVHDYYENRKSSKLRYVSYLLQKIVYIYYILYYFFEFVIYTLHDIFLKSNISTIMPINPIIILCSNILFYIINITPHIDHFYTY